MPSGTAKFHPRVLKECRYVIRELPLVIFEKIMYYKRTRALMTSESHELSGREESSNCGQTQLVKVWSSCGLNPKQMSHELMERNVLTAGSCGVTEGKTVQRKLIICERMLLSQWSTCGVHSQCAVKMWGEMWFIAISLWKRELNIHSNEGILARLGPIWKICAQTGRKIASWQ